MRGSPPLAAARPREGLDLAGRANDCEGRERVCSNSRENVSLARQGERRDGRKLAHRAT